MKFIRACIITDHHYYAPYLTSQAEYISCSFTGVSWAFYWQDCPPQGPLTWLVPLTNFPTNFLHLGQTCLLLIYLYFLPQTPAGTVFSFSNTPWLMLWAQPRATSSEKPFLSGRPVPPSSPLNWNFTFVQLAAMIMSEKPFDLSSPWWQRFAGIGLPRAWVSAWPTVGPQWTCIEGSRNYLVIA